MKQSDLYVSHADSLQKMVVPFPSPDEGHMYPPCLLNIAEICVLAFYDEFVRFQQIQSSLQGGCVEHKPFICAVSHIQD